MDTAMTDPRLPALFAAAVVLAVPAVASAQNQLGANQALEADQQARKYTADELKAIRDEYRAKARELKRETANV